MLDSKRNKEINTFTIPPWPVEKNRIEFLSDVPIRISYWNNFSCGGLFVMMGREERSISIDMFRVRLSGFGNYGYNGTSISLSN